MNMRKYIIAILASALLGSLPALADGTAGAGPYGYRFGDNWFVQAGGGANSVFNQGVGSGFHPAAEVRFGKWFTPAAGLRLGAQGIENGPNGTETGWFSGNDSFSFFHADVDLMWNVLNTFRYRERRFWDVCPFVRGSAVLTVTDDGRGVEPSAGFGVHNGFRLSRRVDLYLEAAASVGREKAWRERGNAIAFPSATAGIVLRIGRTGFRKAGPPEDIIYEPVYVDRVDTVTVTRTVVETVVEKETVVDSVLVQQMRETPLTLYFEIDQTVLTQRELDHLERYAHFVLTPDSKVLLTGSADKETGNPDHNQRLSEERNAYVKAILKGVYGLREENIVEVANGDRKNEFRTPEQNRCVTISFVE